MLRRTELLLGTSTLQRIQQTHVIIFGVGGVGSWCAEALVRSGVCKLTLVDSDCVSPTNCNRQLMATQRTLGQVKVQAMKERLLEINPDAEIVALQETYSKETADTFNLQQYDFVIDAIDSLQDKAHLILHATSMAPGLTLISSMGAALRLDPAKVTTSEFWKVKGDALARALRNKFKKDHEFPSHKFICVYSEEPPLPNLGPQDATDTCAYKMQINGSMCPVTATFGLTLASIVLQKIHSQAMSPIS